MASVDDLEDQRNVAKFLRELLIKADVNVEFDLTDPKMMETIRDVLVIASGGMVEQSGCTQQS